MSTSEGLSDLAAPGPALSPGRVPSRSRPRPGAGDWTVIAFAALVLLELLAFANRYGFDRDELYFVVAGAHPAFGYPDQPPLVPLICRAMYELGGGSLLAVRAPSAIAAALTVVVAALIAREIGGGQRARAIAAGTAATSAIILATGHFVTTTTFDVLSTSLLGLLVVRTVARHDPRMLALAGVVVGVGFEAKPQIGIVAVALLGAAAVLGPRWIFRSAHLWTALGLAALIAAPYLIWQGMHGWPQIEVAHNIGGSAEGGRAGFIPFQIVLVSPFLMPVWIAGLVSPFRDPSARDRRFISLAFGIVAALYLVGDGKAYYLASLYPLLIGLGAVPVAAWLSRGRPSLRWTMITTAVVLSAGLSAFIALPLLPLRDLPHSLPLALNPDLGETVGWPEFDATIASVWGSLPRATRDDAVIFTGNYGEAGAIDLLGKAEGLPAAYSAHDGFSFWAVPPDGSRTVVAVGYSAQDASRFLNGCRTAATITNSAHLTNQEHGNPILVCSGAKEPWSRLWPRLQHLD